MVWYLDHLDEIIDGQSREPQSGFLKLITVVVVDLVAVPVPCSSTRTVPQKTFINSRCSAQAFGAANGLDLMTRMSRL